MSALPCRRRPRVPSGAALAFISLAASTAAMGAETPELRHHLEARWATEISSADDVDESHQSFRLTWRPELEWQIAPRARLQGSARLRVDAFDELVPGRADNAAASSFQGVGTSGDQIELELRELYVEWQIGKTWWTFGKQQIVWGKADGLKVLDVVNPQDFREFILEDFEESRIPLWALRGEIPVGPLTFEPIWIPDRTYHRLPSVDARFALTSPRLVPPIPEPPTPEGLEVVSEDPGRPSSDRSEVGFRISSFVGGWDLTFNYLYHFADIPVPYRTVELVDGRPTINLAPEFERTHLVGGTFANAFGSLTLRGEVGYSTDRFVPVDDLSDPDGVEQSGELAWVLGLDGFGFTDTLWSVQIFRNRLTDATARLFYEHASETRASFLLRRTLLNERLEAELLWLHDLDVHDGLVRGSVRLDWTDTVRLEGGVDVFYGDAVGLFGQFAQRDRLVMSVAWSP